MDPRMVAEVLRRPLRENLVLRPPKITLEEALAAWRKEPARKRRPKPPAPSKCLPTTAKSIPALENNIFCRILAAKPKMDAQTRDILPSFLLTKVGVDANHQIGPVPFSNKRLRGPRAYLSCIQPDLPKGFVAKLTAKYPEMHDIKSEPQFDRAARQIIVDEITNALQKVDNTAPPICSLKPHDSIYYLDISCLPDDPVMPSIPDLIPGGIAGVHLATLLYKYSFIERWRKANHI